MMYLYHDNVMIIFYINMFMIMQGLEKKVFVSSNRKNRVSRLVFYNYFFCIIFLFKNACFVLIRRKNFKVWIFLE